MSEKKICDLTRDDITSLEIIRKFYDARRDEIKADKDGTLLTIKNELLERAKALGCVCATREVVAVAERQIKKEIKKEALKGKNGIDYSQFLRFNEKGLPTVDQNAVFEYVAEHNSIIVFRKKPYIYQNGVYELDNDGAKPGVRIKSKIAELIHPSFRTARITNDIYERFLQDDSLLTEDINNYPKSWINFRNGFYDVKEKVWIQHSPEYYSVNQIPWEYHPEKTTAGDKVEEFLNYALYRENARELFLEYVGLMLTPCADFQKFLMLTGQGGNGKSVLLKMAETIIGSKNLTRLGLTQVNSDKFAKVRVLGKLANICADLKTDNIKDCQTLKIMTGADGTNGEYKGVDGFEFIPYVKFLFSVNGVPRIIGEESDALYRRMMVLTVDRKPKGVDVDLSKKLAEQAEYFLHLCVEAAERLFERGSFIYCADSVLNVENARKDSNSIDAFIAERCFIDPDRKITRKQIYDEYEKYCKDEGRIPKSRNQFYSTLREKGFKECKCDGNRGIAGITLRPDETWTPIAMPNIELPKFGGQTAMTTGRNGDLSVRGMTREQIAAELERCLAAQKKISDWISATMCYFEDTAEQPDE